mmetsp:Transcript_60261/g.160394  ORF Transcript_60261/g.160394 Transcript_60261/m.160394 type:complete len:157 (-) Transcript_60261:544-1014(-)
MSSGNLAFKLGRSQRLDSAPDDEDGAQDMSRHVTPLNGRPGMLVSLDVDAFVAGSLSLGCCRFPGDEGPGQLLEDHFGDGLMWRVRWLRTNCWGIYASESPLVGPFRPPTPPHPRPSSPGHSLSLTICVRGREVWRIRGIGRVVGRVCACVCCLLS